MKTALMPYFNFNGNTAEAMKFYQSVLGGELTIQTFEDAKMAQRPEDKNRTMHAVLKNDMLSFMASDGKPGQEVKFGDNVHITINGDDEKKLTGFFNKLSQGGTVVMPLGKQFWGDTFGMLTDKFGVHWMVNISAKK
jgi:PhnB protein